MGAGLKSVSEFENLHGKMMDGLIFCQKAIKLLHGIRAMPDGKSRLRRRNSRLEKRLIEEIVPITTYIRINYCFGRTIRVRWVDGNQPFDAEFRQSGCLVEKEGVPKHCFVEVTNAVHPKDYLLREKLDNGEPVFGLNGLQRKNEKREIISEPVVENGNEFIGEFASIIKNRIEDKNNKEYPQNTILVVRCDLNSVYLDDDWRQLIEEIKGGVVNNRFMEIFILARDGQYRASLFRTVNPTSEKQQRYLKEYRAP